MNLNIDAKTIKNAILNFLVPIIALVVTVALVLIVIIPSIRNLPALQQELTEVQGLEDTLETKLSLLDRMLDFSDVVAEYVALFSQALTDEPKVPELLTQIDRIARESGLAVTKLNYSITDAASLGGQVLPYNLVVVNLGTLGTYDQVTTFLSRMENASRLVDVVSYRFAADFTAGEGIYSSTFILSSPYRFVSSNAVTDVPINMDIASTEFMRILDKARALTFYDITAATEFTNIEESTVEEVTETTESTPSTQ